MILAQARDGGDAVDERHVQVDHDRVGLEGVGELDRLQAVRGRADHGQLGLVLDQRLQRFEEGRVVVRQENANRRRSRFRAGSIKAGR